MTAHDYAVAHDVSNAIIGLMIERNPDRRLWLNVVKDNSLVNESLRSCIRRIGCDALTELLMSECEQERKALRYRNLNMIPMMQSALKQRERSITEIQSCWPRNFSATPLYHAQLARKTKMTWTSCDVGQDVNDDATTDSVSLMSLAVKSGEKRLMLSTVFHFLRTVSYLLEHVSGGRFAFYPLFIGSVNIICLCPRCSK